MPMQKTVLTTGEVARICHVAPRTVSKWFDSGQLRGYRIPGSKDRRIPIEQLIRFMRTHGIPLNGLSGGKARVAILDGDAGVAEALATGLRDKAHFDVCAAASVIELGAIATDRKPQVLVIDVDMPDVVPSSIARWLHTSESLGQMRLIGIAAGLTRGRGEKLLQDGFDGYLAKPFELRELVDLIRGLLPEDAMAEDAAASS